MGVWNKVMPAKRSEASLDKLSKCSQSRTSAQIPLFVLCDIVNHGRASCDDVKEDPQSRDMLESTRISTLTNRSQIQHLKLESPRSKSQNKNVRNVILLVRKP